MKTTLRIFRIISKLLLLAYVTIVNFVFITVFYALLLSILRHIWPAYIPGLFDEGMIPYLVSKHSINSPFHSKNVILLL